MSDPEDLPQVLMTPHDLINVAEGKSTTTRTLDGTEVRVRIPTASELMAASIAAGRRLAEQGIPEGPGMTQDDALRLTTPLTLPTAPPSFLDSLRAQNAAHRTAEDLINRVDPTIAVDRALGAEDRIRFMARLTGPWQGAQPADYLDEANNADAHAAAVEDWFAGLNKDSGAFLPAQIAAAYGIPEVLASGLLNTAVVACIILDRLDRAGGAQAPVELAGRAALYVRGIADALGVQPPEPAGPDDQLDSLI